MTRALLLMFSLAGAAAGRIATGTLDPPGRFDSRRRRTKTVIHAFVDNAPINRPRRSR
jgi:hypothetical protein